MIYIINILRTLLDLSLATKYCP